MLVKPIARMVRSSTVANTWTIFRHLRGARKGIIPSITSIRQIAVAKSSSTTIYHNMSPQSAQKKPGEPDFFGF